MIARYYRKEATRIRCELCHHQCLLGEGATGRCGVRAAEAGTLTLPYYGQLSSVQLDPIEKKPLYHFYPGERVYSIGLFGCNLHCAFCQNASISQTTRAGFAPTDPEQLVADALESGAAGLAYTYNEPTIHIEYVVACAEIAAENGLRNVLVTNGSLSEAPAHDLLSRMDAVNVDLKSIEQTTYQRLGGDLSTTLHFIELAATHCHLEVTTLLVTGLVDHTAEIDAIARFLATLSPDLPYHLSRYHPSYRYVAPATPAATMDNARRAARRHLNYVYTGNMARINTTTCRNCGAVLVKRSGYRVDLSGLSAAHCTHCGRPAPIVQPSY